MEISTRLKFTGITDVSSFVLVHFVSQIRGLEKALDSQDGADDSIRIEISSYKSRISELQGQINRRTNQVLCASESSHINLCYL